MNDKLRLIHAGVGGMGKAWRDNATRESNDFEIVAIVDINDAVLHEAGEELNLPQERRFRSLDDAVKQVRADALLTVTPPPIHIEHACLAFEHGLHVLTEKPIADTLENAKSMVKSARDANRQLLVAQNYRFSAVIQTLRHIMRQAQVGALGHGHIDFYIAADFTGSFRETMEFPLLIDMAIHHLDLIRAVTGRNIVKVTAQTFRPTWSWYQHHPGLKILLELDDGTPFSYSGDWSALGRQTTWNGTWRLQCAEGSIHLQDDAIAIARCERWGKNRSESSADIEQPALTGQAKLLSDFAHAIRSNHPAETSGQDNLWSFAAVIAGVISARERRTVDVAELLR
jgi:predicted dehydrogenase